MKSLSQYIKEGKKNQVKILTPTRTRGEFVASDSLYQEALEKFGENAQVINPAYTNYGGTAFDVTLIRLYKENEPDKIVWEETSWNGENAICLPLENMDYDNLVYSVPGFEEKYLEIWNELIQSEADYFCKTESCEEFRNEVEDWLSENGYFMATNIDFDWDELKNYITSLNIE